MSIWSTRWYHEDADGGVEIADNGLNGNIRLWIGDDSQATSIEMTPSVARDLARILNITLQEDA